MNFPNMEKNTNCMNDRSLEMTAPKRRTCYRAGLSTVREFHHTKMIANSGERFVVDETLY